MDQFTKGQAFAFVLLLLSESEFKRRLNNALAANPTKDQFWVTFSGIVKADPFKLSDGLVDDRRDRWEMLWSIPGSFSFGEDAGNEQRLKVAAGMKPSIDTSWRAIAYAFATAITYAPGSCPNSTEAKLIWSKLNK